MNRRVSVARGQRHPVEPLADLVTPGPSVLSASPGVKVDGAVPAAEVVHGARGAGASGPGDQTLKLGSGRVDEGTNDRGVNVGYQDLAHLVVD